MPKEVPHSEKDLLRLSAAGDEQAFRQLFDAYRDKLYYYILRMTESRQAAEDVLQDIFLKIWLDRPRLETIDNFNAWLYRLAMNHTINGLKRMARETLVLAELGKQVSCHVSAGTDERLVQRELKQMLDNAVNRLPSQQKLVYHLSRVEGLKHSEIASQLNISPLTVKKHMQQALYFIREQFNNHYQITPLVVFLLHRLLGE